MTDQRVFTERYNRAYHLCHALLNKKLQSLGKESIYTDNNLIQSILASLPVTDLIMQHDFDILLYKPVLLKAIEETRKELFPDLAKKRFVSVENIKELSDVDKSEVSVEKPDYLKQENSLILQGLPEKSKAYIEKILSQAPYGTHHLNLNDHRNLLKKVSLITLLFPDQKVPDTQSYLNNKKMTENQIINIYKCVLSGIDNNFPVYFLKYQSKYRARVLIRFLFINILRINDPENFLTVNKDLFTEYKLQNVLRFFNYSVKQTIHNAFPEIFVHWEGGKTKNNYWDSIQNRISAVRWLVEIKLGINVNNTGKIHINKRDFNRFGLSYLFNKYYNSVSKALKEAYPALKPWQIGSLPSGYWDLKNTRDALTWILDKLQWHPDILPDKYNNGQITRKTFSKYGLSGVYENKFNSNIFNLVNYVWPGKFKEWEFGNIPAHFWNAAINRERFSQWFLKKFHINMFKSQSYFSSLDEVKEYRFYSSLYKYCNGDFSHLLKSYAYDLAEQNKSRLLLRKWDNLIKQEKNTSFHSYLTHGIFYNLVKTHETNRIDSYKRMKSRLERVDF